MVMRAFRTEGAHSLSLCSPQSTTAVIMILITGTPRHGPGFSMPPSPKVAVANPQTLKSLNFQYLDTPKP